MDTFGSEVKMLLFDIFCENLNQSQFNIFKLDVQDLIMRPVKRLLASKYEYVSAIILLHEFQHALEYRLVVRLRFPWLYEIGKIDLIIGN